MSVSLKVIELWVGQGLTFQGRYRAVLLGFLEIAVDSPGCILIFWIVLRREKKKSRNYLNLV